MLNDVHLVSATYSWPCVKQDVGKNIPTLFNVCPWDLFMVMQNAVLIGNCLRKRVNGNVLSASRNVILGMKTVSPLFFGDRILHSTTWEYR